MEIFNNHDDKQGYPAYTINAYDDILRSGKHVFAIAADDNHNKYHTGTAKCDSFGGYVMIKANELKYTSITDALFKGNFYSSTGPEIYELYVENIDHYRHKSGVFCDLVTKGLDEADDMLGMIIDAAKDAGVFEETNFVITSDHGQINKTRHINLNYLFAANGLIQTDSDGNITDWTAWCNSSGMSAQIHLKNPEDKEVYNIVYNLLKEKRDEGLWGISEVYTRKEFNKMHLDGDFSFVAETDGYTAFKNPWDVPAENLPLTDYGCVGAEHGFHPDKGPRPPFLAYGPDVLKGVVLPEAELVDGAPTYAKIMGVELPDADGRVLTELIKN